jgi:hypothetical protein
MKGLSSTSNIRLVLKNLPGTNTLAYFAPPPIMNETNFVIIASGIQATSFFSFQMVRQNKMEGLSSIPNRRLA